MTSEVSQSRKTAWPPIVLLPAVLLVALFSVVVFMAHISPGRVTTGIYQVVVWEGNDQVVIPTESLSCSRAGETVTCTAPVASDDLAVSLDYTGVVEPGGCTARYDGGAVPCSRQMGFPGHASHTVWLSGGLGLTANQLEELRANVPWWRDSGLTLAAQASLVALGVAMGAATFAVRRRSRPTPPRLRPVLVVGTVVLGLALFVAGKPVINPLSQSMVLALSPLSVLGVAALAAWQWELSGPPIGGRIGSAAVAGGATVAYSTAALLIFGFQSGFID
jgi:hypothetical protein